jgi:2-phosphosulfolactate phosphatase
VALTPDALRQCDVAVVIDVLRATSTIAQALSIGYERVLCVAELEQARALRGPDRVLAGERGGVAPSGFDLGNSPAALRQPLAAELVLTTTNGSPAIVRAAQVANTVMLASIVNLEAVLRAIPSGDVVLVCCGIDGRFGLEDGYVAGRISAALDGDRSDAAVAAECIARGYDGAAEPLHKSADAQALARVGLVADVDWCARESVLDVVPVATEGSAGMAVAELGINL